MCSKLVTRTVLIMLGAASLAGCAAKEPQFRLIPAAGFVNINGQPVANIMVQTMPDTMQGVEGPTSTGITDERGRFVLATVDGVQGAVVGPCRILLIDMEEVRAAQGETAPLPRLSAKYSIANAQSLTGEIREDGKQIAIEIQQ